MRRPRIGIPTRTVGERHIGQSRHYLEAIVSAGALPVMIPCSTDRSVLQEYADVLDGLLLPGSPTDIDPRRYGAEPHPKLGGVYPEREETDYGLLEASDRRNLPVLGICFGAQSLNVYRGGTLVQDIPSVVRASIEHDQDKTPGAEDFEAKVHEVRIAGGSTLHGIAGTAVLDVNSYHHQSIDQPGRGLNVTVRASDGVVEGVEETGERFVVGVQWHPERGWRSDAFSRALFRRFVEEAKRSS